MWCLLWEGDYDGRYPTTDATWFLMTCLVGQLLDLSDGQLACRRTHPDIPVFPAPPCLLTTLAFTHAHRTHLLTYYVASFLFLLLLHGGVLRHHCTCTHRITSLPHPRWSGWEGRTHRAARLLPAHTSVGDLSSALHTPHELTKMLPPGLAAHFILSILGLH